MWQNTVQTMCGVHSSEAGRQIGVRMTGHRKVVEMGSRIPVSQYHKSAVTLYMLEQSYYRLLRSKWGSWERGWQERHTHQSKYTKNMDKGVIPAISHMKTPKWFFQFPGWPQNYDCAWRPIYYFWERCLATNKLFTSLEDKTGYV